MIIPQKRGFCKAKSKWERPYTEPDSAGKPGQNLA